MKKIGEKMLQVILAGILLAAPISGHAFVASIKGAGMGMTGVAFPKTLLRAHIIQPVSQKCATGSILAFLGFTDKLQLLSKITKYLFLTGISMLKKGHKIESHLTLALPTKLINATAFLAIQWP